MNYRKLILVLFLIPYLSCKNGKSEIESWVYNTWEVTEIISVESRMSEKNNNYNPIIEIKEDGNYNIELDVNHCYGNFEIASNNQITFSGAGCTKICCDSEFSQKFTQLLPQVCSYEIEGNKMKLEVPDWGWINLVLCH